MEINCECPEYMAENIGNVLIDCMERAGDIFCHKASLTADMSIEKYWVH